MLGKSSPFMAARFRLVKYYNLPRYGLLIDGGFCLGKSIMDTTFKYVEVV